MKSIEFLQYLGKGKFSPIEWVVTEDHFLIRQLIEAVGKTYPAAERKSYHGTDITCDLLYQECAQADLFSSQKLIIVKGIDSVKWDKTVLEKFGQLVQATDFPHQLIFTSSDLKQVSRELQQLVAKIGIIHQIQPMYPGEFSQYIHQVFLALGKKIHPEAVQHLMLRIGSDLQELHNQVEKILLFRHDSVEITPQDIDQIVGMTSHFSVFQLIDAIFDGDSDKALHISRSLMESGQHPLIPLSMLIRQIQQLEFYSILFRAGRSRDEIAKVMGIRDFQAKKMEHIVLKYSPHIFTQLIQLLRKFDEEVKTRQISSYVQSAFSGLVLRMILELRQPVR